MKRARFIAHGRYHVGEVVDPGVLLDEAGERHDEASVTFLPPVEPRSVLGLALNYADHADELDMETPLDPAIFFKPPNTWVGHGAPVVRPDGVDYMHYEVELAVAIARRCRKVKASDAEGYVGGFTIANDCTVRDFVGNFYRPPVKAKGWDTFCPIGPYLVDPGDIDPDDLELRAYVNGEMRQKGHTSGLIRKIPELIEFVSDFMTLEPGDLILTGTPKGISHVHVGDVMRLEIEGIGALENPVVSAADLREGTL